MDPDANLAELRDLTHAILRQVDAADAAADGPACAAAGPAEPVVDLADTVRLAELVQALDGWISRGGFLPQAWSLTQGSR